MREGRLFRHGSPALKAAFAQGTISLYRCGEISRLPVDEQEIAVTQWVNRSLFHVEGQRIAAVVIRGFLNGGTSISLAELSAAIRDAVREGANETRRSAL
jgi:hypothetical protein